MSLTASRGRSLRSDLEMSSANNLKPSNVGQKKIKQFSTRSRSKSAASFKGLNKLRRVLTHDGTYEVEDYTQQRPDVMKKSKSSDSLSRKRAISGLSMTALGKAKSNTGLSNLNSGNTPGTLYGGLKPQRRDSKKAVLQQRDGDEMFDDQSTTDEEVEYFTDEEEELHQHEQHPRPLQEESEDDEITLDDHKNDLQRPEPSQENDDFSRNSSNRTLMNQLSYKVPSNLRNENEDRIDQTNDEDDIISANSNFDMVAHSLIRHGPSARDQDNIYNIGNQEANTANKNGNTNNSDQYVPSMILSQSTGVEKHFDNLVNGGVIPEGLPLSNMNGNGKPHSNNFNYINNDFADSIKSADDSISAKVNQPKNDFSTSISSLSSHLHKPPTGNNSSRLNPLPHHRNSQSSLASNSTHSLNGELNHQKSGRLDSLANFNNFSKFLQSDSSGVESRTQQKMWLQRENSIMDLSAQNSNSDSAFLASNIEVKKEFERISREYTNVRRFSNPVNESLNRIATKNRIDIKKQRNGPQAGDDISKIFKNGNSKEKKTFQELYRQSSSRDIDIQKTLTKIWNDESAKFNKSSSVFNANDHDSNGSFSSVRPHARHSIRSHNGSSSSSKHQRTISSLQPTTRAVHRRMENAINQQRL
ncbi:LAFE_0C05556g1_1 [Lachancea fermentati]|uniref:LAFE_0C05556g1_1 n=1 Tax=Lachancea fermentati TaxID=4955 RepID=A0A1G4M9K0_LACFM|nr:LAFE_0C05556g1_1 [Lachancea fermentati]